jgi:hypothetical protein
MFGHFIPIGQGPTNGVIAGSQPAPWLTGEQYRPVVMFAPVKQPPVRQTPVKQPSRDFGAVVHVPRPDHVARAVLDAIF